MNPDHAPHLVLGVRSDADLSDATAAFARASRRVKTSDNPPFTIEQLTAALAQVESVGDATRRFVFRVPADPGAVSFTSETDAQAYLSSQDGSDAERQAMAHLTCAMAALHVWAWQSAQGHARDALRLSSLERTRDEALNITAAALAQEGQTDKAIAALKQAVQGDWNYALQQNLGILALEEDPELAAHQASYWLDAAETSEDRVSAIFMVLNMWMELQDDEGDDELELPEKMRQSLRHAMASDIPEDEFSLLGMFLARNDAGWVARATNWITSPHADSIVARMILARAQGFEAFMDFQTANAGSANAHVRSSIDGLLRSINQAMLEEEEAVWAAVVAMRLLEAGLDTSSLDRIAVRALAAREIGFHMRRQDSEPTQLVFDWLKSGHRAVASLDIGEDGQDFLTGLLNLGGEAVSRAYLASRFDDIERMTQMAAEIDYMMSGFMRRRKLDKSAVRSVSSTISDWCTDTRLMRAKCVEVDPSPEGRQLWDQLMTHVDVVGTVAQKYR